MEEEEEEDVPGLQPRPLLLSLPPELLALTAHLHDAAGVVWGRRTSEPRSCDSLVVPQHQAAWLRPWSAWWAVPPVCRH